MSRSWRDVEDSAARWCVRVVAAAEMPRTLPAYDASSPNIRARQPAARHTTVAAAYGRPGRSQVLCAVAEPVGDGAQMR